MTAKKAKAAPKKATAKAAPPPAPKPAPKPAAERDAEATAAYDLGRRARRSAITRAESPYSVGKLRDEWCKGWDFEDGLL